MNSENPELEAEQSQLLMVGLLAAACLQYARDIYAYMENLHGTLVAEAENVANPGNWTLKISSSPEMKAVGSKLEFDFGILMTAIGQMRECIDPACARSRYATACLKRLITRARKYMMTVRESLLEIERIRSK